MAAGAVLRQMRTEAVRPTVFFKGLAPHYTKSPQWIRVVHTAQQEYPWLKLSLSDEGVADQLRISLTSLSSDPHWAQVC
jgi:hypothetical protein